MIQADRRQLVNDIVDAQRRLEELLVTFELVLSEGSCDSENYRFGRMFARSLHGHAAHLDALAAAEDALRNADHLKYMYELIHNAAVNASLRRVS